MQNKTVDSSGEFYDMVFLYQYEKPLSGSRSGAGSEWASMMVRANNCSDALPTPEEVHAFIAEEKERYGDMIARV